MSAVPPAHAQLPVDVMLIVEQDDRVLLARRANTGHADGLWNLPSGRLDHGESALDGVIRETREETGLVISPEHVHHVATLHRRTPEGHGRIGLAFYAETLTGQPHNAEPDKCSCLAWAHPRALPQVTPYTAAALRHWLDGTSFGLVGW